MLVVMMGHHDRDYSWICVLVMSEPQPQRKRHTTDEANGLDLLVYITKRWSSLRGQVNDVQLKLFESMHPVVQGQCCFGRAQQAAGGRR
jgi:hypothetical protein